MMIALLKLIRPLIAQGEEDWLDKHLRTQEEKQEKCNKWIRDPYNSLGISYDIINGEEYE
jgi:hypothetical protein